MQRELVYRVPFRRLIKLGPAMRRKSYPLVWWLGTLSVAMLLAAIAVFGAVIERGRARAGYTDPIEATLIGLVVLGIVGLIVMGRIDRRQAHSRVNFDEMISLRYEADGLRIVTSQVEFLLKWSGINHLLIEPDGIVISHGGLFFLVPDRAFADAGERTAFIRSVYEKLTDEARARSESHVRGNL